MSPPSIKPPISHTPTVMHAILSRIAMATVAITTAMIVVNATSSRSPGKVSRTREKRDTAKVTRAPDATNSVMKANTKYMTSNG